MTASTRTQVEERLITGILGQWYAVAKSVQVRSEQAACACGRSGVISCSGAIPPAAFTAWRITARIAARGSRAARSTRTTSPAAITA